MRYVLPIWLLILLAGFWFTRLDVRDATLFDGLGNEASEPGEVQPAPTEPVSGLEMPPEAPAAQPTEAPVEPVNGVMPVPPSQKRVARYQNIDISDEEMKELACVVFLEASTEEMRGQQAVVEVILNRVLAGNFPNSVHDVIFEDFGTSTPQFETAPYIHLAEPSEQQYLAIEKALYGPSVLPEDVVFFSKDGENEYVWGTIGEHIFCYQYPWA